MKNPHIVYALLVALPLAACSTSQSVDLEGRGIAVEQGATPMSAQTSASIARLLPSTGPSYVTLTVSQENLNSSPSKPSDGKTGITSGSGFVVNSGGYVLTAAHVAVRKGNSVSARAANGRLYSGEVVGIMPNNDVALVKLRGFSGKEVVPASPGCSGIGDLVYTLGKPHAMGDTARVGTLKSLNFGRTVAYGKFGYPDAIVLNMGTQKGESGGPVFEGNGYLIGMVVSTLSDGTGRSINLAHAIPATALAAYYCSQSACSPQWAALSTQVSSNCSAS